NTVKVNSVNTAKGKRVTSAVGEQGIDAVKSKACWAESTSPLEVSALLPLDVPLCHF
ncbi:hypothetical protein Tco_0081481, partial [Tanacetum coccineum]